MSKKFLISSRALTDTSKFKIISSGKDFFLYSEEDVFQKVGDVYISCEGYFLPRNEWLDRFSNLQGTELIYQLFSIYGPAFINKIKGFFIITIITTDNFYIYNDIHSVRRFYYCNDDRSFLISNNIEILAEIRGNYLNPQFAAHHALFQHFIFGETLFRGIYYSEYASEAFLRKGSLSIIKYWHTESLYNIGSDLSVKDFITIFNKTIGNYIDFFKPEKIEATVTGGRDTRSIIASLVANNQSPHLFTFGNPENRDIIVGKMIAESCNFSFSNPDISNPQIGEYSSLIDRIILSGDSFIHLHRAHRLDAVEKEARAYPYDMVFVGAMGGDYIKGSSFDDYIVSEFLRRMYFDKDINTSDLIKQILKNHFVKYDEELIDSINTFLLKKPFISNRELNANTDLIIAHDIIGCTHDIQDISIFSKHIDKVIAPYMDIDVIESLFKTNFSLLSISKNSRGLFTKFLGGEFQAQIVSELCYDLAELPYANYYKPCDVTGSKAKYLFKRGVAYAKQKIHPNISGFEYGKWFVSYVEKELQGMRNPIIPQIYDYDKMLYSFKSETHLTHEGYWHKYTNPIMFLKYIEKLNAKI